MSLLHDIATFIGVAFMLFLIMVTFIVAVIKMMERER